MLKNKIPELTDNLGNSLTFEVPKFELIESDTTTMAAHKVALNYITGELTLLNTFGEYMVLTASDTDEAFTIKLQDGLSISSYCETKSPAINGHKVLAC